MSPSWRECVRIVLAPGVLELTRLGRGLRPRVIHAAALPVETGASWEDALAALERALGESRWRKGDVEVLLSSHFVRVLLLPWSEALATDAERMAHARAELQAVHGDRVRDWTLVIDDAPPGCATPVCAIDTALLEGIRARCAAAALTTRSVRPQFAARLADRGTRIRARTSGFAFCEGGRLTLALYESGACRWLTNPRVGVALSEALAAELRQAEALGAVGASGRLHVEFAGTREALPGRIAGWQIVPLPGADRPMRRAVVDASLAVEP